MQGAQASRRPGAKTGRGATPGSGTRRGATSPRSGPARRRPSRLKRWARRHPWLAGALRYSARAAACGAAILGVMAIFIVAQMPDPRSAALDDRPPNVTVLAQDGSVLAERGLRRGHMPLNALPPYLVQAVLATEDRRFYAHFGVDPLGLARASFRNAVSGAVVEGGSTITQQLAKNLFLTPKRTLSRKLEEAVYAVWLERRFSKDEILELYLNRVYFGGGTYGVEAASRRYFGKSSREVTLPQAALLAGLLKAPSRYAPTRSAARASVRVDEVLDNMVEAGYLTAEQAKAADEAAAEAFGEGRRHRLFLRRRLGCRASAGARRRASRRSLRRDHDRSRASSASRSRL